MREKENQKDMNLISFAAIFSYISLFAGQLTTGRLSTIAHWVPSLEIRILALMIVGFIILYVWARMGNKYNNFGNGFAKGSLKILSIIIISQVIIILLELVSRKGEGDYRMIKEIMVSIIQMSAVTILICMWGKDYVLALLRVALGAGIVTSFWFFFLYRGPESGPIMSVFTVYRIALFAGFSGLYIFFEERYNKKQLLILGSAVLCFSSSFSTLSKAALLGGVFSIAMMIAVYYLWIDKKRALTTLLVLISAVAIFWIGRGQTFEARVAEGVFGVGYDPLSTMEAVEPPPKGEHETDKDMLEREIAFDAQKSLAKQIACSFTRTPCDPSPTYTEEVFTKLLFRNYIVLPDYSVRLRLAYRALEGFSNHPYVGNGFGKYKLTAINLYTNLPEVYHYPHNFILELLYSVGVLGTAPIMIVLLICIGLVIRKPRGLHAAAPIVGAAAAGIVGALFGGDYSDFRIVWIYLILAYAVYLMNQANVE